MSANLMRRAGAKMANTMFNLAQRAGDLIDSDLASEFDKLRKEWDAAVRATPQSPSTAEVDERAAFEAWARPQPYWWNGQTYSDLHTQVAWEAWKSGRAALASRPAVEAGGLPPLPAPCLLVLPTGWIRYTEQALRFYGQECARAALATKPATKE